MLSGIRASVKFAEKSTSAGTLNNKVYTIKNIKNKRKKDYLYFLRFDCKTEKMSRFCRYKLNQHATVARRRNTRTRAECAGGFCVKETCEI